MSRLRVGGRTALLATVAVLALVALSACAPTTAAPAPSTPAAAPRSATPTPTPTPTIATVVIDGMSVSVHDSTGATVLHLLFSVDTATAVSQLGAVIHETPTTDVVTTSSCIPQLDETSWGGLHFWTSSSGINKPENAKWYVTADAANTAGGLPIEIPSGQTVGAAGGDVLDANVDAPSFNNGDGIDLHYDVANGSAKGDPGSYYGGYAEIQGDKMTLISSPDYYFYDC